MPSILQLAVAFQDLAIEQSEASKNLKKASTSAHYGAGKGMTVVECLQAATKAAKLSARAARQCSLLVELEARDVGSRNEARQAPAA